MNEALTIASPQEPIASTEVPLTTEADREAAAAELRWIDEAEPTTEPEAPAAEAAPAAPAPEPVKEPEARQPKSYEQYIANVARLQQKLRQEKEQARREREANQQLIEQGKQLQELMRLKEQDPLRFIDAVRLDANAVVNKHLVDEANRLNQTPEQREQALIDQMRREVENRLQAEREQAALEAQARHNQILVQTAVDQYRGYIAETIASNEDKYELIKLFGQQERVWKESVRYHQKHGQIADPKIICDAVEEALQSDAQKFLQSKRYAELSAAKPQANNSNGASKQPVTLTNSAAKASAAIITDDDDLSDEQRRELAIKELRFIDD